MKRFALVLTLLVSAAASGQNSQPACNPAAEDCTVLQALDFYRGAPVTQEVVNTNKPTESPDAFAARVHNSYEDYLNLLSFAINRVDDSEDGQSLIVRFNPLRGGRNLLGATLTVTQPGIAKGITENIPADVRDDTVKQLDKELADFDNLIWSVSYSFATPNCTVAIAPRTRCWGRSPAAYRDLLAPVLLSVLDPSDTLGNRVQDLRDVIPPDAALTPLTRRRLSMATDRAAALKRIQAIVAEEKRSLAGAQAAFAEAHIDLLPKLIDNQPQLSAIGSYHTPGKLGGANEIAATLEFHMGRENINSVRRRCPGMTGDALASCLSRQLALLATNGMSTDKWVLTATYKKTNAYNVTAADLGLQPPPVGFTPVAVQESNVLSVKGQGGMLLSEMGGKPMRADASLEIVRAKNNGVRTPNRAVAKVTISLPLGDNITVPLSVTYANKPEFLGDPDERLGAHLGLSYRLPNLFGSEVP